MLRKPDKYASRCAIPGIRSSFDDFEPPIVSNSRAPNLYPKSGKCPVGLEPLENIEHIFLKKQESEVFNLKNNYIIRNAKGQPIYRILETTYDGIGMMKLLTGTSPRSQFPIPNQSLRFVVNAEDGLEVFEIKAIRSPSSSNTAAGNQQQHENAPKVSVRYHGQLVGKIVQLSNITDGSTNRKTILGIPIKQSYQIYDAYDRLLLKLKVPDNKTTSRQSSITAATATSTSTSTSSHHHNHHTTNNTTTLGLIGPSLSLSLVGSIFGSNDYYIFPPALFTTNDNKIGKISKYWGSLTRDYFSTVDTLGVKFPATMDVKTKVLLMAMALMLDIQFFDQ